VVTLAQSRRYHRSIGGLGGGVIAIDGEIQAGEASAAAGRIRRRQIGLPWYLISVVLIPICAMGGGLIETRLGLDRHDGMNLGMWIGLTVGAVAYLAACRRWVVLQFRSRLASRGLPLTFPLRVEVGEKLIYRLGGLTQQAEWSCVSELFRAGGYWVFLAQSNAIFVPRRVFADAASERRFLAEALERMTPAARELSAGARAAAGA
jgi:hypothetical protein